MQGRSYPCALLLTIVPLNQRFCEERVLAQVIALLQDLLNQLQALVKVVPHVQLVNQVILPILVLDIRGHIERICRGVGRRAVVGMRFLSQVWEVRRITGMAGFRHIVRAHDMIQLIVLVPEEQIWRF